MSALEKDAISAGTGSLVSSDEIKILLCYVIKSVDAPVPGKQLANLFHLEAIANYFEVINALEALISTGSLSYFEEDDTYFVTKEGAIAAQRLKKSLPFTIREKAFIITSKLLASIRHQKETKIDVTTEDGIMYITCSAIENDKALMSFKLMVADEIQAQCIKERFLEDPAYIYTGLIDLLTGKKKTDD